MGMVRVSDWASEKLGKLAASEDRTVVAVVDRLLGRRAVSFAGAFGAVPIYDRERLPSGAWLAGPAVIEESGSTTVVPPGWALQVLGSGDLLMQRKAD